jgi:hypothetical protein
MFGPHGEETILSFRDFNIHLSETHRGQKIKKHNERDVKLFSHTFLVTFPDRVILIFQFLNLNTAEQLSYYLS